MFPYPDEVSTIWKQTQRHDLHNRCDQVAFTKAQQIVMEYIRNTMKFTTFYAMLFVEATLDFNREKPVHDKTDACCEQCYILKRTEYYIHAFMLMPMLIPAINNPEDDYLTDPIDIITPVSSIQAIFESRGTVGTWTDYSEPEWYWPIATLRNKPLVRALRDQSLRGKNGDVFDLTTFQSDLLKYPNQKKYYDSQRGLMKRSNGETPPLPPQTIMPQLTHDYEFEEDLVQTSEKYSDM
jgi:hypothetical protein